VNELLFWGKAFDEIDERTSLELKCLYFGTFDAAYTVNVDAGRARDQVGDCGYLTYRVSRCWRREKAEIELCPLGWQLSEKI
jgi:hypothetical protein